LKKNNTQLSFKELNTQLILALNREKLNTQVLFKKNLNTRLNQNTHKFVGKISKAECVEKLAGAKAAARPIAFQLLLNMLV